MAAVRMPDESLFWLGAVFTRHASGLWRVEDNSSRHGVFVNGLRVEKPHLLRQGDVISLGPPGTTGAVFRFLAEDIWNRGGDAHQRAPDAVIYTSPAFLVLIGSVANQLPRALDGGTEVDQEAAAPAAGEDGSVEPGVSPNSFAAAGRNDASSNHSKNIGLSAGDRVSRTMKSTMKSDLTCLICSELFEDAVVLQCGHVLLRLH
ncbi:hypothetical protein MRX96_029952 [Rhipicephalus microplus]